MGYVEIQRKPALKFKKKLAKLFQNQRCQNI